MIFSIANASIRRRAGVKFRDSSFKGSKGKRTYVLTSGALTARLDNFNRADSTSIITSGLNWEELRGDWQISSNQLYTATAASSYPLAALWVNTPNATTKCGQGASGWGWGVSFWVVDQDNWFSATTDQYSYTYSYEYSYVGCPSGYYNANCGGVCTPNGYSAPWGGDPGHACGACGCRGCYTYFSGPVGTGCPGGGVLASSNYNGSGQDECAICGPSTANFGTFTATATATGYRHRLILRKAVSGTVVTVSTSQEIDTSQNARPSYVSVVTSGNTATITAPMDNSSGTLTINYNGGANDQKGLKTGVTLAPTSAGTTASTLDNFEYAPGT